MAEIDGEDDHVHLLVECPPFGLGEQPQGRLQPLAAQRTARPSTPLLEGRALGALLLRRFLRQRTDRPRAPVHRAAADTRFDTGPGAGIEPPPEARYPSPPSRARLVAHRVSTSAMRRQPVCAPACRTRMPGSRSWSIAGRWSQRPSCGDPLTTARWCSTPSWPRDRPTSRPSPSSWSPRPGRRSAASGLRESRRDSRATGSRPWSRRFSADRPARSQPSPAAPTTGAETSSWRFRGCRHARPSGALLPGAVGRARRARAHLVASDSRGGPPRPDGGDRRLSPCDWAGERFFETAVRFPVPE